MMIYKKVLCLGLASLASSLIVTSCITVSSGKRKACEAVYRQQDKQDPYKVSPTLGGKLFTSAWIQRSAEYDALCLQAYNSATDYLHQMIKQKGSKPWAIVTDIDETVVDNTPISVSQALKGEDYTENSWNKWCEKGSAEALSGAVKFFYEADKHGVQIFYISNRNEVNRTGTIKNLRRLGLPQAEDSHLLLRTKTSDKSERRAVVLQNYDIMMFLGDALGDFDHIFDTKDEAARKLGVKKNARKFGTRFIVLPNPNYGAWEKAMNGGYPSLEKKDKILTETLQKD